MKRTAIDFLNNCIFYFKKFFSRVFNMTIFMNVFPSNKCSKDTVQLYKKYAQVFKNPR